MPANTFRRPRQNRHKTLYISLDPGRDTAERLKGYAGYFHPNIIGRVDKKEAIDDVCQR
ncbi:MAG: SCO family protein [Nitrospinota bacterium]